MKVEKRRLTTTLTTECLQIIERVARGKGVSRGAVIEMAIREYDKKGNQ